MSAIYSQDAARCLYRQAFQPDALYRIYGTTPAYTAIARPTSPLGATEESMQTTITARQTSPSMMHRVALAVMLSLVVAIVSAIVIPQFEPGFFGSNFEGSSGYMAMFIFVPAVMLVLTPILVIFLRNAGQLSRLGLWFLVQLVLGFFFFTLIFGHWLGNALWLGGLIALSWKIAKQWRRGT